MTAPLTPKEKECLDYIVDYRARFGFSPTYRKIAAAIGLQSTSGVFRILKALETAGLVRRGGSRRPCSIEVLDQNKCPHCGNALGSSLCREAAKRNITYSSTPVSAGAPA